jgi:uncharacterized membrane protein
MSLDGFRHELLRLRKRSASLNPSYKSPPMEFLILKTVHVLSSAVLFGTGLGTAFHMWVTHRRGDVRAIAATARNVVRADWLFTATSGVVQPVTGLGLILLAGYDPAASWLVVTYALYAFAGTCWLVVVLLQIQVAAIARQCAADGAALPEAYHHAMRAWFWLGWPAFLSLIVVYWLMIAQPQLW